MYDTDAHPLILPSLFVTRFVVLRDTRHVYDQSFHLGVNIIRGDNGTGKSTIMDLLSYALGAEITDWTDEQLLCTSTLLEVSLNDRLFCLRRDIKETGKAPMDFFEGTIGTVLERAVDWYRYPNRRSADKHSYSQQLFEMLGLPQHKTDDAKNLTVHQIMRLIYVDQLTQTSKLLKEDTAYDNAVTRRAIGEYMLGIDDLEAHNLRQELIESEKRFESMNGELKAIYKILGGDATIFRRQQLLTESREIEANLADLEEKRKQIRATKFEHLQSDIQERIRAVSARVDDLTTRRTGFLERKAEVTTELVDTILFTESLQFRIESLNESRVTYSALGGVEFKYCPACLSPLDPPGDPSTCSLCKTSLGDGDRHYAYLQMINELNFQMKESRSLIDDFRAESSTLEEQIKRLDEDIDVSKREFLELTANADIVDAAVSDVSSEIGFLRSQLLSLRDKMALVDRVEALVDGKASATAEISTIKEKLRQIEELNKDRYQRVYSDIEQLAARLLRGDGGYEKAFEAPEDVSFDFARDRMAVNGRAKFSASSMVVLKNSIRLAIFMHCVEDARARFPRILLLDNVEDKGMMEARSQNFQRLLVESCARLEARYQVIFTTSMVDPNLSKTDLVAGSFYRKGEHTLKFS